MIKKMLVIISVFFVVIGCSSGLEKGESSEVYPDAIVWNNTLYGISSETVSKNEIGKELGKITSITRPLPKKSGESNNTPIGSKIYEIISNPNGDKLAVEIDGIFKRANKLGPVQ